MTKAEKLKYVKAAIVAAVSAAGIGAYARDKKAKKDREKALDIPSSRNAIVVPVSKSKFLEGIQTPEEHRKMFADSVKPIKAIDYATAPEASEQNSIDDRKKEILRGRKFDFFGKRASVKKAQPEENADESSDKKTEVVSEEKIDGRVVLRGQDGKFVSPTDPVAVHDVEKDAFSIGPFEIDKWWQPATSPFETMSDAWRAAKGKPLYFTAGAVGSMILAAKISDAINERRREKAKHRLEKARDKYVELLDGSEKAASTDHDKTPGAWAGSAIGAAFLVPMALTALVTNKIIENRKAEKKRQKEMSDSYPEDPIILYQTHDGDNMKIAASTALMAIMVKRDMIEDAEKDDFEVIKSAQATGYSDKDISNAVNFAVKNMTDPKKRKDLLRFIKARQSGDEKEMESAYRDMMPFGTALGDHYDIAKTPEFRKALASSGNLQDAVVGNLENDNDWKAYRDEQIDKRITGWGLDKNGILFKIIQWLAKNLGFGNAMAKKYVMSGFDEARDKAQAEIDKRNEDMARAEQERAEQEMKSHFAPLENFKGSAQDRQKLENSLNDSWMVKHVNGIQTPEEFQAMAKNMSQISPGSPQYKTLYDALSKRKDIDPSTFASLAQPAANPAPSPAAPATQNGQSAYNGPLTFQDFLPANVRGVMNAPGTPSATPPAQPAQNPIQQPAPKPAPVTALVPPPSPSGGEKNDFMPAFNLNSYKPL